MVLSPREELLLIQKQLFRRNQRLIKESILIKEPDFDRYEQTYKRYTRNYQSIATVPEMIQACLRSDIIYVGDYHTCNQSQRSFLRILKAFAKRKNNFIIGLELLHRRHQKWIDLFLKNKLSEETFIKKVGLKEHWVFDLWENFKPIFDFAKHHEIPIIGIDAAGKKATIRERDRATAKVITHLTHSFPKQKIFVFIGDLHIAPPHLPHEVQKELRAMGLQKKELLLYQNSESIYWKLAKQGEEHHAEIVRINENSFCRMHTPPVILQRSYLNWLEHEEGEIDFSDAKHQFIELVDRIADFLKLDVGKEKEKVEVYTSGDLSFLRKIKKNKRFSNQEFEIIKHQIISEESYYIPRLKIVYLGNLSLNHAGEEAAHFIKHICSGEEKPRDPFDAFYANVLHEALGFFGSKIINHKRKCYHERDFLTLLQHFRKGPFAHDRQFEQETALLVYQIKTMENRGKGFHEMEIFQGRHDLFFSVTHALGYMLGDLLYYGLLEGVLHKSNLRHLFYDPWRGDGKPFQVYWNWITEMREVKIPKRM